MSVLQEILTWSYERPLWQRDALRRLSIQGELDESDVCELAEICKTRGYRLGSRLHVQLWGNTRGT